MLLCEAIRNGYKSSKLFFVFLLLLMIVSIDAQSSFRVSFPDRTAWNKNAKQTPRIARQSGHDRSCQTTDGLEGWCCPFTNCFYQYANVEAMHANRCQIRRGEAGVCCPVKGERFADEPQFVFHPPPWPVIPLNIRKRHVVGALDRADEEIESFFRMESNFLHAGQVQRPNSMSAILQSVFGPPNENLQALNIHGLRTLGVTKMLGRRYNLSPREMRDGLSQVDLYDTPYQKYCPRVPRCNPRDRYRTIDGSCNNLQNPLWGKSNTQYSRFLPPSYSDGISELRNSVTGVPLPLARVISNELFITSNRPTSLQNNVLMMQWGQFIDHDMTLGSSTRASNGQGLMCCNMTQPDQPVFHPACRPIIIPDNDPFYLRHNRKCNNFVRNAPGPKNNCNLGYREQTNIITSFLDASMVYGNNFAKSRIVRLGENGLLKTSRISDHEFLPFDTMNNSIACAIPRDMPLPRNIPRRCIFAGDVRVNQQVGIITLQLMFLREHNRLVRYFKRINLHWDDEKLYQEARRIVGAEIQHITYNEWLPLLIGRGAMKASGIMLQPTGHCDAYDPRVNPSILNEFASSAFRLHTLVQEVYRLINRYDKTHENHRLHRSFNNPAIMYRPGAVNEAAFGLVTPKAQAFDNIFVEDLKNFLFPSSHNARFGMDLIAINIQRGRDHGMPRYNAIRRACGLYILEHFRNLNGVMQPGMAERFALVYEHVNDIDFYVGGANEIPIPGAIVGPTFACVITEQFRRLKFGDRFWYENGGMDHSFTSEQLKSLRHVSLAGIICANGDDYQRIQPLAMLVRSKFNREVDCQKIPQINLQHWKEESSLNNDYNYNNY